MEKQKAKAKIITFFKQHASGAPLPADTDNLIEKGFLDSLTIISFSVFLENEFHIPIAPADISFENFSTIETILDFIKGKNV